MDCLRALLGRWEGDGVASYPTIDTVPYRELLIVRDRPADDVVIYEQQTWTRGSAGNPDSPSHWETGFFVPQSDGSITVLTAHRPRTEVLVGTPTASPTGGWRLELDAVDFLNDPRMVADHRALAIDGSRLSYVMEMTTASVQYPTLHLEAQLRRR